MIKIGSNIDSGCCSIVASRRNEAASWLRNTVGNVGGKDMLEEPSEEDFRYALRSGIILCNALNKIQPGAVPKVCICFLLVINNVAPVLRIDVMFGARDVSVLDTNSTPAYIVTLNFFYLLKISKEL